VKKKCSGCDAEKPINDFHVRRASKDGLARLCKPCAISYVKSYENKEAKRVYDASYQLKNAERLSVQKQRYMDSQALEI
jgi:hypothetical protein